MPLNLEAMPVAANDRAECGHHWSSVSDSKLMETAIVVVGGTPAATAAPALSAAPATIESG